MFYLNPIKIPSPGFLEDNSKYTQISTNLLYTQHVGQQPGKLSQGVADFKITSPSFYTLVSLFQHLERITDYLKADEAEWSGAVSGQGFFILDFSSLDPKHGWDILHNLLLLNEPYSSAEHMLTPRIFTSAARIQRGGAIAVVYPPIMLGKIALTYDHLLNYLLHDISHIYRNPVRSFISRPDAERWMQKQLKKQAIKESHGNPIQPNDNGYWLGSES